MPPMLTGISEPADAIVSSSAEAVIASRAEGVGVGGPANGPERPRRPCFRTHQDERQPARPRSSAAPPFARSLRGRGMDPRTPAAASGPTTAPAFLSSPRFHGRRSMLASLTQRPCRPASRRGDLSFFRGCVRHSPSRLSLPSLHTPRSRLGELVIGGRWRRQGESHTPPDF